MSKTAYERIRPGPMGLKASWADRAAGKGMRFLRVEEEPLKKLTAGGSGRGRSKRRGIRTCRRTFRRSTSADGRSIRARKLPMAS